MELSDKWKLDLIGWLKDREGDIGFEMEDLGELKSTFEHFFGRKPDKYADS